MSVSDPNDPKSNAETADRLQGVRDRATQEPISYLPLLREALEIADDQMHRAMCAEVEIARLRNVIAMGYADHDDALPHS